MGERPEVDDRRSAFLVRKNVPLDAHESDVIQDSDTALISIKRRAVNGRFTNTVIKDGCPSLVAGEQRIADMDVAVRVGRKDAAGRSLIIDELASIEIDRAI